MDLFNKKKPEAVVDEKAKASRTKVAKARQDIKDLKARIKVINETHASVQAKMDREHKEAIEFKDRSWSKLNIELQALKQLNQDSLAVKELEIGLETKERILKAKEGSFDGIAKELAANRKNAEDAREEGIKKGYADGVADGLREASKITADDRKMAMQIAALAASSHTPDAATEIAKTVLKDVANVLPATTKKR